MKKAIKVLFRELSDSDKQCGRINENQRTGFCLAISELLFHFWKSLRNQWVEQNIDFLENAFEASEKKEREEYFDNEFNRKFCFEPHEKIEKMYIELLDIDDFLNGPQIHPMFQEIISKLTGKQFYSFKK